MSDDERARLEAAGLVAPIVRGMDETTLRRRVHTYDRETGEPVREVTVRQLIGGLAKVTALEVEVIEGKRPASLPCEFCGKPVKIPPSGPIIAYCRDSVGGCDRQRSCAGGCGAVPTKAALSRKRVATRNGLPWRCQRCAMDLRAKVPRKCLDCGTTITSHADTLRCLPCSAEKRRVRPKKSPKPPPRSVKCSSCKAPLVSSVMCPSSIRRRNGSPPKCKQCMKVKLLTCAGCGVLLGPHASRPSVVASRKNGAPPRCASCDGHVKGNRLRALVIDRQAAAVKAWATKRAAEAAVLSSRNGLPQKADPND